MRNKESLDSIFRVFLSNFINLLAGFLVSLFIPKIMGVSDYGMYKIFTLYITYTSLLEIGYFEGIYLKYSGKNKDEIDYKRFRTYTKFFSLLVTATTLVFTVVLALVIPKEYLFVVICVGAYGLINNLSCFFEMVAQSFLEFKKYSFGNILRTIIHVLIVAAIIAVYYISGNSVSYQIYVILYLINFLIVLVWYLIQYRKFAFGDTYKLKEIRSDNKEFFKTLLFWFLVSFGISSVTYWLGYLFEIIWWVGLIVVIVTILPIVGNLPSMIVLTEFEPNPANSL